MHREFNYNTFHVFFSSPGLNFLVQQQLSIHKFKVYWIGRRLFRITQCCSETSYVYMNKLYYYVALYIIHAMHGVTLSKSLLTSLSDNTSSDGSLNDRCTLNSGRVTRTGAGLHKTSTCAVVMFTKVMFGCQVRQVGSGVVVSLSQPRLLLFSTTQQVPAFCELCSTYT